jgi:hypothetical protein
LKQCSYHFANTDDAVAEKWLDVGRERHLVLVVDPVSGRDHDGHRAQEVVFHHHNLFGVQAQFQVGLVHLRISENEQNDKRYYKLEPKLISTKKNLF